MPRFVENAAMMRRARPEQALQKAVCGHLAWRAATDCFWFHPPNGGWRSAIEAAVFKSLGVKPGVPDLILIHRGKVFGLELKAGKRSRLSEAQHAWHERLRAAGAEIATANNIDAALALLEQWGALR